MASEYLFYDVDAIIYCEGVGPGDGSSTFDEIFWAKICAANGLNVETKSVGNKKEVLSLLSQVDGLKRVGLAIDADYDEFYGQLPVSKNILYTFGYSWESDLTLLSKLEVAIQIFVVLSDCRQIAIDFSKFLNDSIVELKRISMLDVKYIHAGTSIFNREKPLSLALIRAGVAPKIEKSRILSSVKTIRYHPVGLNRSMVKNMDPLRSFFGKFILHYVYQWLAFRADRFQKSRKISYDSFVAYLLNVLDLKIDGSTQKQHYKTMCDGLKAI